MGRVALGRHQEHERRQDKEEKHKGSGRCSYADIGQTRGEMK